jgi:glycosyltransferase involved in cell wall biosynthesis
MENPYLSVLLPVFNEAASLPLLSDRLRAALEKLTLSYEIIFVDDGSTDQSFDLLQRLAEQDTRVKVLKLSRNYGQTAALAAGIDAARGEVLIPMDADLQNDPADIPVLIEKLEEGYDVVSGWRKERKDKFLTRRLPSIIANKLISMIGGVPLHDYGCTLKAYRRDVLKMVRLYGEMHRFIPIYASWTGGRVTEVPVRHHPRQAGESKYGLWRTFKVIYDLITIKFMMSYMTKPLYVFGPAGMVAFLVAFLASVGAVYQKLVLDTSFIRTPLTMLAMIMFMLGVQLILLGLVAEMLVRTYHESQNKPIYLVKTRLNFEEPKESVTGERSVSAFKSEVLSGR